MGLFRVQSDGRHALRVPVKLGRNLSAPSRSWTVSRSGIGSFFSDMSQYDGVNRVGCRDQRVRGPSSVVRRSTRLKFPRYDSRGFRLLGSDRVEVGVQHGSQRLGQTGQFGDFVWRQELPAKCPTEEMFRLVEGAPRRANEPPIVGERSTPLSLGDVGAHRIRGSNQLFSDGFWRNGPMWRRLPRRGPQVLPRDDRLEVVRSSICSECPCPRIREEGPRGDSPQKLRLGSKEPRKPEHSPRAHVH